MYKLLLSQRYLRTRYIALASIISVTLGVATMIVVNSVMSGFGSEMRDRIRGILADIVIETNSLDGEQDAEAHMRLVRSVVGDDIDGMTTTVEVYGMLSFQFAGQWITRPVTLIGIDPDSKSDVGPLVDYLQSYQPQKNDNGVLQPPARGSLNRPTWELTETAMAYRGEWAERQKWFLQRMRGHNPPEETEAAAVSEGTSGAASPEIVLPGDNAAAGDELAMDGDPFAGIPPTEEKTVDIGQPLEGRVYVGAGLISYPYEDRETGEIKTMMMVRPGDDVKISTVTAGRPPEPAHFNATVVDLFKSGMSEYDSSLIYCNIEYLQKIRGMVDPSTKQRAITSIQLKLKDFSKADEVVAKLREAFPPGLYTVRTWEQKQGPLLAAVEVESAILNVLLFLIIAVAGFGILAIFFMIVVEKTRDIGILKALGASSGGVMSIFLSYGLSLGIVGSGAGVIVGLLFVHNINTIESWITSLTGRKVFDERIYYFPEIPTNVEPAMVFWVAVGAMAIAVLASILPARRAARLRPVEALRYE